MWLFLATVCMLFAAFFSALLIRRAAADWIPIALPRVLWWNTVVLLASSATLEVGRRTVRKGKTASASGWLLLSIFLGASFLLGQLTAWRELVARGVYVPTSPHSTFFYIFTGVHAVHLLGGLFLLLYGVLALRGRGRRNGVGPGTLMNICATYWHFLGGLWIILFLALSIT